MNAITAYLDTMFSAYPQTPRLLEAKTELHGMMEDTYTSLRAQGISENEAIGEVIRDFGNLEEIAPALGITSDIVNTAEAVTHATPAPHPPVTMEEAQEYVEAHRRSRFRLGASVVLFVLSPVVLIFLPPAAASGLLPITEQAGAFVGILALLVLAAVGVVLFISVARVNASSQRIAAGRFSVNPVVTRWVDALSERHERGRIRALQVAVMLSIVSSIPLIAFAVFLGGSPDHQLWIATGVVILLVVIATALGILLPQTWAHTVADKLTRGARR